MQFCHAELHAGWPVIIGWAQRLPIWGHAALIAGIGGYQHGRSFEPHALLLLDPAGDNPGRSGFNARLECRADHALLIHPTGAARDVTPEGALSIRTVKRTNEPPQMET